MVLGMRTLVVLARNPFDSEDGGAYAIRASLRVLGSAGPVLLTGFGEAFDQPLVGPYLGCGSLGTVANSHGRFAMSLISQLPFALLKYASPEARTRFRRIVAAGGFDLIWYEQSHAAAAAYVSGMLSDAPRSAMHVLRAHNVEHRIVADRIEPVARILKPLLWVEARKLRVHELEMIRRMDRVFAMTPEDRDSLIAASGAVPGHIQWLPIPVRGGDRPPAPTGSRDAILFVGRCTWPPNREAALWIVRRLAPILAKTLPHLRVRLVGSGTEAFRGAITSDNVDCLGFLPSLDPEYARAVCTVAPVRRGSGINVKVLDSLARGVPVVGTCFARRGIDIDGVLIADSVEEFVQQIRSCPSDPLTAERQATEILARFHRWADRTDTLWKQALLEGGLS